MCKNPDADVQGEGGGFGNSDTPLGQGEGGGLKIRDFGGRRSFVDGPKSCDNFWASETIRAATCGKEGYQMLKVKL